jgi:hypothetical protein
VFTRATKDFGIWRENHNSRRRFAGRPTSNFVMSLGVAALVSWLAFILVWKIRGDFYLIESALVPIPEYSESSRALQKQRPVALSVALISSENSDQEVTLLFDSGRVFRYPSQQADVEKYLEERSDSIEYVSMLTMTSAASVSRVQIWPDRKVGQGILRAVIHMLAEKGFDDFDIAMQAGRKS